MLRGYRLAIIAFGLTLFAYQGHSQEVEETALESQPVADEGQSERTPAGEEIAAPEPQDSSSLVSAVQSVETAIRDLVAAQNQEKDADEIQREKDDLKAQERMALWAMWMFFAAVGSILLTFAGVILIWRTLLYTRDAARHAGETVNQARTANQIAADAAKAAQDAMRETIVATDRAWIKIEVEMHGPLVFANGKITAQLRYYIKNVGKSPANRVQPLYSGLFPNVIEAAQRADKIIQEGSFVGSVEGKVLGGVLFPDDPSMYWIATHELSIDEFRAGINRLNALVAEDYADAPRAAAGWPGGLVGVRYTLPGEKRFRYTFMPFAIKSPYQDSTGFDGSDCEVSPKFLVIESRIGTAHLI